MISTLEKEITFRFLKARKKDGFLNVISIFSFIGISLGVAVLIIVMSVMNGFRTELTDKIVGFNAHAVVKPYDKPLDSLSGKDFAKGVLSNDGEAVIFHKNGTKGILLKGYLDKDFKDLEISNNDSFFGSKNLKFFFVWRLCRPAFLSHRLEHRLHEQVGFLQGLQPLDYMVAIQFDQDLV